LLAKIRQRNDIEKELGIKYGIGKFMTLIAGAIEMSNSEQSSSLWGFNLNLLIQKENPHFFMFELSLFIWVIATSP